VSTALKDVEQEGGVELAVEATGVSCFFFIVTKIVDATGKVPNPDAMLNIATCMVKLLRWIGIAD